MPKFTDLTGRHFARWTVLKRAPDYRPPSKPDGGIPQWLCRCDCGTEAVVRAGHLTSGKSSSCGCYNSEVRSRICIERNTKHGLAAGGVERPRTYRIWASMMFRCGRAGTYARVVVCEKWREFTAFVADMGECPSDLHTLDRIDNSKGYEPGNCRWATMREQQNNRTNNRRITWLGETHTLMEWSRKTGINRKTIERRLEMGWSVDEALSRIPSPLPR